MKKLFLLLTVALICLAYVKTPAYAQLPAIIDQVRTIIGTAPGSPSGFKFFCQYDPKYQTSTCSIAAGGCMPTSVAMSMYSLGKITVNPLKIALANGRNGCTGAGSSFWDFVSYIRNQGLTTYTGVNLARDTTFNYSLAKSRLAQGCYLVSAANMIYRSGGSPHRGDHATVITKIDPDNTMTVMDPTFCRRDSDVEPRRIKYRRDTSTGEVVIFDWYYVYPVCP